MLDIKEWRARILQRYFTLRRGNNTQISLKILYNPSCNLNSCFRPLRYIFSKKEAFLKINRFGRWDEGRMNNRFFKRNKIG